MIQKWNILIMLIPLFMGTCNQTDANSNQDSSENRVFLNNEELVMQDEDFQKLHTTLLDLLTKCDDFYEQIVTTTLIDSIKSNNSYLEIFYAEKVEVNIGNKQTMVIRNLLIPLSGKYQSNDEITFFCGTPEYSSEPYINLNGFDQLDKVLKSLQGE